MIVKKTLGNVANVDISDSLVELVSLEWFELSKSILRKIGNKGTEIGISLEAGHLHDGDILFQEGKSIVAVDLLPCDSIIIKPKNLQEMLMVAYQLGNRHAAIFTDGEEVIVPFDATITEMFAKLGIETTTGKRKLEHAVQSAGHHH